MPRLDLNTRQRVIIWHSSNIKVPEIVERLKAENITTTDKTICFAMEIQ